MSAQPLLPEAATDNHIVVFGMTGAGKSSVIRSAIVEPDLEAERRVLAITPKDDWWGLRLSKTGKSKGYDVPIFGGFHADYPLNVKDAALLAETYGTMKGSAIFCTARMSVTERTAWLTAFAETLLTKNKGRVRVVIDEAHVFMPKAGGRADVRRNEMLNAGNELVSSGRSQGLRIVLASQRPAKLHNDSSTQCKCLIAMQLMAPHDRNAVKDWIEDVADPEQGKAIIASLADLKPGEAWVWAPRAKMLERIQFPRPLTFDSSKPPDDDAGEGPTLPPINLDALQGKLAKVEAEKKANDPAALRNEVAALKAEKAKLEQQIATTTTAPPAIDPAAIAKAEERGFEQRRAKLDAEAKRAALKAFEVLLGDMTAESASLLTTIKTFADNLDDRLRLAKKTRLELAPVTFTAVPAPQSRPAFAPPKASGAPKPPVQLKHNAQNGADADGATLTPALLETLGALAWWAAIGIEAPTRAQLGAMIKVKPGGSTMRGRLAALSAASLIDYPSGSTVRLTDAGTAAAPAPDTSVTLIETIRASLSRSELETFDALPPAPRAITRADLGEALHVEPGGSTMRGRLAALSKRELIHYPGGHVARQDWVA